MGLIFVRVSRERKLRDAFQGNQGIRYFRTPLSAWSFFFSFYVLQVATVIDCPVSGRQVRNCITKVTKRFSVQCERREAFRRSWIISLFTLFVRFVRVSRYCSLPSIIFINCSNCFCQPCWKIFLILFLLYIYLPFITDTDRPILFQLLWHSAYQLVRIGVVINDRNALFRRQNYIKVI